MKTLPKPPKDQSIHEFFKSQWDVVISDWQRGWVDDETYGFLIEHLESERKAVFLDKTKDPKFNWEDDWLDAEAFHTQKITYVNNRKKYIEDIKVFWNEWYQNTIQDNSTLRVESLRAMVLVNGAAIIACFTVISGGVSNFPQITIYVAKWTILVSAISLILTAIGHAVSAEYNILAAGKVKSALIGHTNHKKLYSLSRYIQRFYQKPIRISQYCVYGAIILFGANAFVSACALMFA